MPYNPNKELLRLADLEPRLLFYPSSGINKQRFFDQDYDVFVFVDNVTKWEENKDLHSECRRKFWKKFKSNLPPNIVLVGSTNLARVFRLGDKWGFLFFQDNNEALNRIMKSFNRISAFIGICDGCAEGGNYECVNDANFFKKVLFLMNPKGMTYLTDHTNLLTHEKFIIGNKHLLKIPTTTDIKYEISSHETMIHLWQGNSITLTLEHDSIGNHIHKIDGALVSKRCKRLCMEVCGLHLFDDMIDVSVPLRFFKPSRSWKQGWTTVDSLMLLLNLCEKHKWNVVGTTAFGEGNHSEIFDILNAWEGSYPKHLRIFYLDDDDFEDIKLGMIQLPAIPLPKACMA
jgi:hypothetical protein